MTFTGSRRDLSTLAHELGHAVHFYLSRNQKNINYHAVLPMAETASVFGEMLLTKNILAEEQNPEARKQLLANKIEDMINTVFAQNAYTRFEQLAYQKRDEKECSTEELGEIWVDQFKRFYGDAVDLSPLHQYVWQGIPHFVHTRFYCYAYTFGELLSLSLYRQYEENPESEFKKQLNTLLSKGCSEPPQKMLEPFEIDLKSKAFWKNGFKVIEEFIHELEKIS
jgi:oligoendopeptidase F